jgi:conjugative transfer signal peptidase TraF
MNSPLFQLSKRAKIIILAAAGVALMAAAGTHQQDLVIFNPSHSVPAGFYVRSDRPIERGALVTVRAVSVAPAYATLRQFTDPGDRFIKRIAGVAGDEVCAEGQRLSLNGVVVARRLERDGAGHILPTWSGCRVLAADEILLLGDTPDSFDGRYWGPVTTRMISGVWRSIAD